MTLIDNRYLVDENGKVAGSSITDVVPKKLDPVIVIDGKGNVVSIKKTGLQMNFCSLVNRIIG